MKRNAGGYMSDAGFLLFVILCFVGILFVSGQPDAYIQNILFLNAAFMIGILVYFTGVTTGLVLNMVFIFAYGTYTLYQSVAIGNTVTGQTYFWLLMTPLYTAAIWLMTSGMKRLQAQNESLKEANAKVATMDQNTNLRNSLSFQKDATVYMALSTRYAIPLTLLVMQVRYWSDVRRLITEDGVTDVLIRLSELSETSIRGNDLLYMLDKENATWGLLLFSDMDGGKVVADRLRGNLARFYERDSEGGYRVELQLRIGEYEYDAETVESPLDFIDKARKQLEYDV
ncbi:GGDEF domain-containing protein [Paenibacillus sp. LHD-117]|uniref:GGDEF domain-containing protein n=1 Tax=Paenibacillus sp. LHD-117 TaxID=3071412 RepID=UPI0027E13B65|nr:GGDEF domain-containing protein [Paenibacillus sp. LHD-117]MDQ6421573.1 GGDEF domain-containing protein [Paenibacillus sp. LHD-117]